MTTKAWVKLCRTYLVSMALISTPSVFATEPVDNFKSAITQAVMTNPQVSAAMYDFEASLLEQRAAKGGYYPKIDLVAEIGNERSRTPARGSSSYTRDSTRLQLTQMLFDGFATKNEVDRLDHAKRLRFYELKNVSEETALAAAQTYMDVLRQQKLVALAEENYVQHQLIYDDINERVSAGVSRRVDLEQARARSSLASTNLLTETSNLYDVSVRFQRIVGDLPADNLVTPSLPLKIIPDERYDALERAYKLNPQLTAAMENVLSAQADMRGKNAPMLPRFDLRLRQELDNDTDGLEGSYHERAVEVVMTYNLYNGGSDRARKRQFSKRLNSARKSHEKTCRDVRQTVSIAHNDIKALTKQVEYLNENQISVGKARQTYRKQFDIGQRSLLDLLDTENEYFEVRRSYVNATLDLLTAQARTLAGMGILAESLNVESLSDKVLEKLDDRDDHNGAYRCPPERRPAKVIDKQTILDKAMEDHRFRNNAQGKLSFTMEVQFATNSADINELHSKDISDAAMFLIQNPNTNAVIEGHTDNVGSECYNLALSQHRAESVRNLLIKNYAIESDRLTAQSFGMARPIADNETPEGRNKNRRVEMVVAFQQ